MFKRKKKEKLLYQSLASFQQEVSIIYRGTTGFGYKYADLSTIVTKINPFLKKNDLGFTQLVQAYYSENMDLNKYVETVLFHVKTGEKISSRTAIPNGVKLAKMNEFQVLGSGITYIRRYALSSMLGLVTDKDNDGAGEQVKTETEVVWMGVNDFKSGLQIFNKKVLRKFIEEWSTDTHKMKKLFKEKLIEHGKKLKE